MAVYHDNVLYVDNTTLSNVATCPTKAMVRYGFNLKPEDWSAPPLQAGIAIHQAIECHYLGGSLSEVIETFSKAYKDYAIENVEATERLGYQNVLDCIESWIIRHPIDELPYLIPTPDHIEMPFNLQLDPNDPTIRYTGRIDALVKRHISPHVPDHMADRSALYVLDTKSTGQPYGTYGKQFELSPQMSGYTWAAQQLFPDERIVGIMINMVHVYMIPRQSGTCKQHKGPYSECRFMHPKHNLLGPILRTSGELEEWRVDAYNLARSWKHMLDGQKARRDLDKIPMTGKWIYRACELCELHAFCRGGRQLNSFPFVTESWIPGDLAETLGLTHGIC